MKKKLSDFDDKIVWGAMIKHSKGHYYYFVPTTIRRNGQMKVSKSEAERLIKKFGEK